MRGGSPKGGPQSKNLIPVRSKDDPVYKKFAAGRDAMHARNREAKARRHDYKDRLGEIKSKQLDVAQTSIQEGVVPEPMQLLMNLIEEQQVILSDDTLSKQESIKERSFMLELQKQYTLMLNALAPTTQSLEINKEQTEELSEEDYMEQFKAFKG